VRVEILERRIQEANCTTERKDSPADGWLLGGRFCVWNVLCLADFKDLQEKPALFWEHKGRLFSPVCHVSCVLALGCSILSLGVLHGPPEKNSHRAYLPRSDRLQNAAIHQAHPATQANGRTQASL